MARDPGRLSVSVTHADGRVTRWGPDEVDGRNIPNDLTFSTSIPGGFQDMTCSLLRRIDQDYPDQDLFDDVTVYGPGNRIVWQGRMQQFPRSHGSSYAITPGAVGWSAHLRDNPSFRQIIIDRDASHWTEPSLARRAAKAGASEDQSRIPASAGSGLEWVPPNAALAINTSSELFYDAGPGLQIAGWAYVGTRTGAFTNFEAAQLYSADTDTLAGVTSATLTLNGANQYQVITAPKRYLMLRAHVTTATTPAAGYLQQYSKVAAVGNHGITLRTSGEPGGGVYASDVILHVLRNAAPLLHWTIGDSIQATSFPISHLVYQDPITAEAAVSDVNKYHLWDWGVEEDRTFFYRQPDPDRMLWEARLGDGASMDADGLTGETVINGVFVTYTDPVGTQKTVGPPGGQFDTTTATLADTSQNNPANAHGITAKWDQLSLSFPTVEADAIQIGAVYLAERSLATRRGSMTLTGTITHPTEGQVPVWRVRAGDWIRVADLNGENADVPRKIISTSYSHQSRSISLNLDNTVAKLDAILSRVGVQTGIATGGGF